MLFRATHFMSFRGAKRRENLPEGTPYKAMIRCVPLARCGIIFVIAKHKQGIPRDTMWKSK